MLWPNRPLENMVGWDRFCVCMCVFHFLCAIYELFILNESEITKL